MVFCLVFSPFDAFPIIACEKDVFKYKYRVIIERTLLLSKVNKEKMQTSPRKVSKISWWR